jgi:hypothetical protein
MIDINDLRKSCAENKVIITQHAIKRLLERGITMADIIEVINNGEIIRQYEDDKPFPSCLVLGKGNEGIAIHTVVSHDGTVMYVITGYYPDPNIWYGNFKVKK